MKIFEITEAKVEMCPEACCGKPVTECKCGPDCEHCDCHEKNKVDEGKKTESYKESLALKLENVQQQRKAVAEDLAPTKDQLKGKELDALRNKNVAKMDAEDKAARKKQADKFAAMKNESTDYKTSLMNKLSASLGE